MKERRKKNISRSQTSKAHRECRGHFAVPGMLPKPALTGQTNDDRKKYETSWLYCVRIRDSRPVGASGQYVSAYINYTKASAQNPERLCDELAMFGNTQVVTLGYQELEFSYESFFLGTASLLARL